MTNTIDNYYVNSPCLKEKHDQTKNHFYQSIDEIENEKGQIKINQHFPNYVQTKHNEEPPKSSRFKKYIISVFAILASLCFGIIIGYWIRGIVDPCEEITTIIPPATTTTTTTTETFPITTTTSQPSTTTIIPTCSPTSMH